MDKSTHCFLASTSVTLPITSEEFDASGLHTHTCTHKHRATYTTKCIQMILKLNKNRLFLEEKVCLNTRFQIYLPMPIWVHCFGACYQARHRVGVRDGEKHFISRPECKLAEDKEAMILLTFINTASRDQKTSIRPT